MLRKSLIALLLLGSATTIPSRDARADDHGVDDPAGAVFVMTNDPAPEVGNEVVMYLRGVDGRLAEAGRYATGGLGSGPAPIPGLQADGLGSQRALIATPNGRFLVAVNARSNDVSVLRIRRSGLTLVERVASGGDYPVSLAMRGRRLYVLNAGGEGNITGFEMDEHGALAPISGSTRTLAQPSATGNPPIIVYSGAQVAYTPAGDQLVVTVKEAFVGPGRILVFGVGEDGRPSAEPYTTVGTGETPFAFTFGRQGHLLVSEVFGAAPDPTNGGAVSSYAIAADGHLDVVSDSVAGGQGATCWIEVAGRFAYTANVLSQTISRYRVASDGTLTYLGQTATAGVTFPLDIAPSPDGRFLYVVQPGTGTVGAWAIDKHSGDLTPIGEVGGLESTPLEAPTVFFSTDGGSVAGIVAVDFR